MLTKRIIPCLDCDLGVPEGRVVKGIEFQQITYAGIPWKLAAEYGGQGADELVFLDITASNERRETMANVIERTASNVFIPLTVGGGIRSVEDAKRIFNAGADKISVNTAAIKNPRLVNEIAGMFGSQACVVAIDAKRRYLPDEAADEEREIIDTEDGECWFECSFYGGKKFTGVDALKWAQEVEERGAGEILLTSMDRDGTKDGFDIELTKAVCDRVNIPVIASGGCGEPKHMKEVFESTDVSAALAASIFHYKEYTIGEVKQYLEENGISVRL
ncbi:MAG: imidazole glycerol phosphate synthase subunit HisF [Methanocellales archaeon]|nr:imidazole glycerol phosphate synthase subunit HisF [Methanocellales archaeon]MDD3292046.1 imidazole glycerol phosphate synthase subunit HisF [Methanocellales archaeon]MDD5235573.1 imidazole glycerol phosphate synthase subunit HisF [Methanocellales archaeon]MDD5485597.1 imidazole glycerol phosphate synthase subunit HisF [Methanocellales archaeon]